MNKLFQHVYNVIMEYLIIAIRLLLRILQFRLIVEKCWTVALYLQTQQ